MKFGTVAVTALLAVASVALTATVADAKPTNEPAREVSASGIDNGVEYRTTLVDGSRSSATSVDRGRFALAGDRITLTADSGALVTAIPLAYEISGSRVAVAHTIGADGRTLTLTPEVSAAQIGEMQPVSSMARLIAELEKNVVGAVGGAVLGGLLGAILGVGFFSLLTGPIGMVVGAVAGAYVTGGQPFLDAMTAVVSGAP
ncbi:hypothetical protein [Nocardia bovistercoris]|uniref:DUF8020 domain-containing protein n=1 Tax=Nocardia bovistercoris TaxID=2785916 RepID=A0A931N1G3_9NOCA|nr:hypothetical protein [Nocardia bovistercoris]MBH0778355.1 hypothetical protein [Nocardia bovistercoris]